MFEKTKNFLTNLKPEKIKSFFNGFNQILTEGHYHAEPIEFWLKPFKPLTQIDPDKMPQTASVSMGTTMLKTSQNVYKRIAWMSVFLMLSFKIITTVALILFAGSIGLYAYEYKRCKRARDEIITEVNFAGQKVRGTRADLCRLHMAQENIMNLGHIFKQASMESTADTIQDVIDSMVEERRRVQVLSPGRYGASSCIYDFSEPSIKLVNEHPHQKVMSEDEIKTLRAQSLRKAWGGKDGASIAEVAERFVALERSLPVEVLEEIDRQRSKQPQSPAVKPSITIVA